MLLRMIAVLLILLPGAAAAEWVYQAGVGPSGRALGFGSGGQSVGVECGNGGYPAVVIYGPRPVGGEYADYLLRVDQQPELFYPAFCTADGCLVEFEDSRDIRQLFVALAAGRALSVDFFRNGPGGVVPLAGAAAAIERVFAAGCERP